MTNHLIRCRRNLAYNKPFPNNFVISKVHKGNDMDKENDSLEMEENGMKVTLLFPKTTTKEVSVENDIKMILSNILQEYLTKRR